MKLARAGRLHRRDKGYATRRDMCELVSCSGNRRRRAATNWSLARTETSSTGEVPDFRPLDERVDERLNQILHRALARDVNQRYATGDELLRTRIKEMRQRNAARIVSG